ncbi:hypothetical protein [Richelia intracellularis]|nr:hypothetical protein [Richelia intracellularis]
MNNKSAGTKKREQTHNNSGAFTVNQDVIAIVFQMPLHGFGPLTQG